MKKTRIIFNFLTVLSSALLVGILAYENLTNSEYDAIENIFLQVMHFSLLIAAILNILFLTKNKQFLFALLTGLPLVLFIVAFIGFFIDFKFSSIFLLIFDFYILFWFNFLFMQAITGQNY